MHANAAFLLTKARKHYIITMLLGEWLNGRVVVSKTIGCVFESRLPCQTAYRKIGRFFILAGLGASSRHASMLRIRVARDRANSLNVLSRSPRQRSLKGESRLPCQTRLAQVSRVFLFWQITCSRHRRNTLSVTFSASFRNLSLVVVYYNFAPYCKNLRENVYAESNCILALHILLLPYMIKIKCAPPMSGTGGARARDTQVCCAYALHAIGRTA